MDKKWPQITLLSFAELLAMTVWFSASAVVPQLTREWQLSPGQQSWITMSVQLGFVVGALVSAVLNIPDRISSRTLVIVSCFGAAIANALIPLAASQYAWALVLRFLTGAMLAGVYPPGMKLIASWTREDRGLGIGILIGALAIGSAVPHLLSGVPFLGGHELPSWRVLMLVTSGQAAVAALLVKIGFRPGPYLAASAPFNWRYAGRLLAERPTRLANFGYLGHMWELYAMWTWVPLLVLESYRAAGWSVRMAHLVGFAVIAIGAVGCIMAGKLADRMGRTAITIASLVVSGSCALVTGFFFSVPAVLTVLCLVWGFAVVADSAQFSAAVSELTDPRYVGTALTVQTSLGFLLTLTTIHIIPQITAALDWNFALMTLTIGPVAGIVSMYRLRTLPEAVKMAGGNR